MRFPLARRVTRFTASLSMLSTPAAAEPETLLPEVSVSARADTQAARRDAPTARIVFHREELEALDAASVAELLRKLPGTGMAGDLETKRGRGKGPDRHMPRILVDGDALPGDKRSPGAALRLPVDLIERVEIIRGASAKFPHAGPGGTINLVLRDVPPRATRGLRLGAGVSDGEAAARVEGQYGETAGDFGYLWSGSINRRPLAADRVTQIQTFAAGARDGWRVETDSESGRELGVTLAPRFTWQLGSGGRDRLTLSTLLRVNDDARRTDAAKQAYADPVAGTGLGADGRSRKVESGDQANLRLSAEWKGTRPVWGELTARLFWQAEREDKAQSLREYDVLGALARAEEEDASKREGEWGFNLKSLTAVGEEHVLSGGLEWRDKRATERQDKTVGGVLQPVAADSAAEPWERRLTLWAQDEWQLAPAHLLTTGLRWQDGRATVTDGLGASARQSSRTLEPSLHYRYQPDPTWNARAGLALSERPAGLREISPVVRAASGDNSAANPDKSGNPQLKAQRTLGLDLGMEHFFAEGGGNLGLSVYLRRVDSQVQKLTRLEGARWVERPYNVGEAVETGALLDFKLRPAAMPRLTLRGNAAHSHSRLTETVAGLGAGEGPRSSANLGFDYVLKDVRLTLGGNLQWTDALERESSPDTTQTQGARHQLDLHALYKLDKRIALRLSLNNVTGEGKADDLVQYSAGNVSRLESDRQEGARSVFLAFEGKW